MKDRNTIDPQAVQEAMLVIIRSRLESSITETFSLGLDQVTISRVEDGPHRRGYVVWDSPARSRGVFVLAYVPALVVMAQPPVDFCVPQHPRWKSGIVRRKPESEGLVWDELVAMDCEFDPEGNPVERKVDRLLPAAMIEVALRWKKKRGDHPAGDA